MDDLEDFLNGITGPSASGWTGSDSDSKQVSGLGGDIGMFELGDLDSIIGDYGPIDEELLSGSGLPVIDLSGIAKADEVSRSSQPADISPFAPQWPGSAVRSSSVTSDAHLAGMQPFSDLSGMSAYIPGAANYAGISPPSGTSTWSAPVPTAPAFSSAPAAAAAASNRTRRQSSGAPQSAAAAMQAMEDDSAYGAGAESEVDDEEEGEGEGEGEGGDDMEDTGHGGGDRAGSMGRRGSASRGVKNSGSSNSLKNMGAEERRAKRLERNRESARQSRRRKKAYLDLLEGRVSALQAQLFELRTSHAAAASTQLTELRSRLLANVEPIARKESTGAGLSPEEEASLHDAAAQLVSRFGPDCPERRAVRDFHFDQLQRLLLPPHTKFLLWLVHQPPDFFSPGGPASGSEQHGEGAQLGISVWTLLCAQIGLSTDQAERLRTQLRKVVGSPDVPRETWRLGVATLYLQRLRAALDTSARKLQSQLEAVKLILTPAQLVRYSAWVDANRGRLGAAVELVAVSGPGDGVPVGPQ